MFGVGLVGWTGPCMRRIGGCGKCSEGSGCVKKVDWSFSWVGQEFRPVPVLGELGRWTVPFSGWVGWVG